MCVAFESSLLNSNGVFGSDVICMIIKFGLIFSIRFESMVVRLVNGSKKKRVHYKVNSLISHCVLSANGTTFICTLHIHIAAVGHFHDGAI